MVANGNLIANGNLNMRMLLMKGTSEMSKGDDPFPPINLVETHYSGL